MLPLFPPPQIGFHLTLNDSYGPLSTALPLSLAHKSYGMPAESGHSDSVIGQDEEEQQNLIASSSINNDKEPLNQSQIQSSNQSLPTPVAGSGGDTTKPPVAHRQQSGFEMQDNPVAQEWSRSSEDVESHSGAARAIKSKDFSNGEEEHLQGSTKGSGVATPPQSRDDRRLAAAFAHPATKDPQQIIWVPRDALGLGEEAVRLMKKLKIEATDKDATINEKVRFRLFLLFCLALARR